MARRNLAQLQFDALSLEGALLPPEWLARVAALEAPAQLAADYAIPKGLQLRDEIGRFWRIAQATWAEFAAARGGSDPIGASNRLTRELLSQVFGFGDLAAVVERRVDGRAFPLAFEALSGRVPVVVGPPSETLDQNVARHGDGSRRRSAWGVLQEYLNASDGALWGLTTNGLVLRIGRDNASLTRPAWLEADLERIFDEDRFADFSVLWLLLHASRFGRADQPLQEAPLERWREEGRHEGSRARDVLRLGVEEALRALGQGFVAHHANSALREALASGALAPTDYFNELLRLIYRAIFLLTVEERGILHTSGAEPDAVALYASGYGMRRLRERSVRHSAHDRHGDLWASLRPVFAALGQAEGEPSLALPGLGGLFAHDQCPHLDGAALENRALLTAVFRLAWLREGSALARVNWKDMGVEEFGSVYESLLELVPVVSDGGRRFGFAGEGESAGNARKLTGSYYTPDALVQQLLDTALEPVVAERLSAHPNAMDAERALLSLTVVDPACGSGHFLLAAARRLAGHLARLRSGGTPGAAEYRHALRDVVTHCIHGVDRNPMALELARMALWLEAYTPDRALGFVDHHLVCGDALLGLLDLGPLKDGIPDEAFKALTGDDKDVAKLLGKLNRAGRKALEQRHKKEQLPLVLGTHSLADAFRHLDALADDGIAGVEAKRARYSILRDEAASSPLAVGADIFVGAFLVLKQLAPGERALTEQQAVGRFPTTATLVMALEGTLPPQHPVALSARSACSVARVLHWPLAFPQVFARGGFDVVLGNPPWEVSQLSEEEFFAVRAPQVARAKNKAARAREIAKLEIALQGSAESRVYSEYTHARRLSDATNVAYRSNPRFALTAVGKINTYALFAESMYRMTTQHGRAGMIVPTGIVSDDTTKAFFAEMSESGRLASLYDFENRDGLFPGVHRSYKFAALTIGSAARVEFAFYAAQVHDLNDSRRRFTLTPPDFRLLNPNTRTCPIFRTALDADLTKAIYRRLPVLVAEGGSDNEDNPWAVSFSQGLFNMATDSGLFLTAPEAGTVPLYEAKMIHQFDHRWATNDALRGEGSARELTAVERADPDFVSSPRYWVPEDGVQERLAARHWKRRWLLGWRNVCRATDERTGIWSVLPYAGVGHSMPIMLCASESAAEDSALLLAAMNSLACDYVVRQKVAGVNYTFGYLRQIAVPPPSMFSPEDRAYVVDRVLELTYTATDMEPWARDLGFRGPPFSWDADRRARLRAELDAWYARAYGLTRDELRYVLDPVDVMGADWPSETFRVLKNNELRDFGEYRTRRLVLAAYDALNRSIASALSDAATILNRPLPVKPDVDEVVELALVIFALVREAGDALTVTQLTRALVLRCNPAILQTFAPPVLTEPVNAWSRQTIPVALPTGSVLQALGELVGRLGLRWVVDGTERSVATTEHTPTIDQIHERFRFEAALTLRVLRAMPAAEAGRLDVLGETEGGVSSAVRSA